MKNLATICGLLFVLVLILVLEPGCATLTQTSAEHIHSYDRTLYHDSHLLPEDVDTAFLMDRPSRLSRWIVTY
jgi:hypothetical protein